MKSSNKRRIVSFIIALILVTMCFAGCGKASKNTKETSGNQAGSSYLSKAEYAGMLGDTFGYSEYLSESDIFSDVDAKNANYSEIQALSEWKIIDDTDKFMPDEEVTLEYALVAAVRAVGIEDIQNSGETVDESKLTDFYTSHIAEIDAGKPEDSVSEKTARQIIGYALEYSHNLSLPQIQKVEFAEGVKTAQEDVSLYANGSSGKLGENSDYQVGDIIYFAPTDTSVAKAVEVTEINGDEFQYTEAQPEDIFENLEISGTYDCSLVSARSVSDSTVVQTGRQLYNEILENCHSISEYEAIPLKNPAIDLKVDNNSIMCHVNLNTKSESNSKDTGSVTKTELNLDTDIGIKNIKAKVDVEYKHGLQRAKVELTYDTIADSTLSGSFSKTIPLGEFVLNIAGPLNVKVQLKANIAADGHITVSYTTQNLIDIDYAKAFGLKKKVECIPVCTYDIDASACLEATLYADIRLATCSVVNADATTGVAAHATSEGNILEGTYNSNIYIWVPLRFNINDRTCMVTKLFKGAKISKTVWDSDTSKFKWHLHDDNIEEKVVEEGEEVEIVDENGQPVDEQKEFSFEPLEFDFIELSAYIMFVNQGETQQIGLSNIPKDYTEGDILYESGDTDVCIVASDGTVTAVGEGAALITVTTSDRTTTAKIAVIVGGDISVDFEPL